jgi:hypothetical protein
MNKVELAIYAAALHCLDKARYNIFPNPDDADVFTEERNRAANRLRDILLREQAAQSTTPPK